MGFADQPNKNTSDVFVETKRENGVVTYETPPQKILETHGITLTASMVINRDEETAALHREATQLKYIADWDGAIESLKKAQERMRHSNFRHPAESWLRLPLFLQQGGRFDEAMEEFNRILDETDDRIAKECSYMHEYYRHGAAYFVRGTIYGKMSLACKRQKLPKEAEKYKELREKFLEKHDEFMVEWEKFDKIESARKRAELEKQYPSLARRKDIGTNSNDDSTCPQVFRSGRQKMAG